MRLIEQQRGKRWTILDNRSDIDGEYGHITRRADGTFHVYAWDGSTAQDHIGEGICIKHALQDSGLSFVSVSKSIQMSRFYK
jgi:hypothetical protein